MTVALQQIRSIYIWKRKMSKVSVSIKSERTNTSCRSLIKNDLKSLLSKTSIALSNSNDDSFWTSNRTIEFQSYKSTWFLVLVAFNFIDYVVPYHDDFLSRFFYMDISISTNENIFFENFDGKAKTSLLPFSPGKRLKLSQIILPVCCIHA